ncbi:chaperone protein DnaJ [Serratia quinivorans]|nr:chaperone protein DnaJ [Serratia quinivorans]
MLGDSTPATASDSLTISDVMAALGMCQAQAEFGLAAFLGKVGISEADKVKAVVLLAKHGMAHCDKVAAIRKLPGEVKARVVLTLAVFAYMDYCRSAASEVPCDCCHGEGFIDAEVFTNKIQYPDGKPPKWASATKGVYPSYWEEWKSVREVVRVMCPSCKGKGNVSTACRDCSGRGVAVDRKETAKQGVPVRSTCKRCSGRGYERIPSTQAYMVIAEITDNISLDTWKKSVKPFYDEMITHLDVEESIAGDMLMNVTR